MPRESQDILWTAGFLNERFNEPVSPLGWSHIGSLFEQIALRDPLRYMGYPEANTIPATRLWHGFPYVNVRIFQILYKPFPDALLPADVVRYFPNGDVALRRATPYPSSWLNPRFVSHLLIHLARDPLNVSPFNYVQWQRFTRRDDARMRALEAEHARAQAPDEWLALLDKLYARDAELLRLHRWSLTYADVFYKILAAWTGELAPHLIAEMPNKTKQVNQALHALGQLAARTDVALDSLFASDSLTTGAPDSAFAQALAAFLEQHGHRAFSLDLATPTFRDAPEQLLSLLDGGKLGPTQSHFAHAYRMAQRQLKGWRRVLLRPLVYFARQYAALREDQRYYWQKSLALSRRTYLRLGDDLKARGILDTPTDIFYLTRQEIATFYRAHGVGRELRERAQARQAEWAEYIALARARGAAAYPPFLRGDTPLESAASTGETLPHLPLALHEWRGRGVSPGAARGQARVIGDPRHLGRVQTGEILVAPSTDPAWTPIFARLAGLALERGGVLSHGAVVAREYHLPAVVGIANLTLQVQDGDWLEVDGTHGIVRRLRNSPHSA